MVLPCVCLISWVECDGVLNCPNCESTMMDESHIRSTSACVSDMLKSLLVRCPLSCRMIVRAEKLDSHLKSNCKDYYESSASSPSRITAKELMSRSTDVPMTHSEKSLAGNFIKRMMAETPQGILHVPTCGQVCSNILKM